MLCLLIISSLPGGSGQKGLAKSSLSYRKKDHMLLFGRDGLEMFLMGILQVLMGNIGSSGSVLVS